MASDALSGHSSRDKFAGGYPIKLVRDDIALRLGGEGHITYEHVKNRAEHVKLLRAKLIEEAVEYLTDPSVGELADVLAVLWALARVDLDVAPAVVEDEMRRKLFERGGFEAGLVMVGHHKADGRDLLPADRKPVWSPPTKPEERL